ncbi:Uma2 family endonuclease [Candidatus Binatia bacterium]|nr:Uma2 family endonuclease [Candidatus Binatia bacterium]
MSTADLYEETIDVPRAVRFPVELVPPEGFDPGDPRTWPKIDGRLEYANGRLLYMPPCGDLQQDTVTDLAAILAAWVRTHPDFVAGTNEAGMRLAEETRGADGAIWRRKDLAGYSGGFRRVPPVLAVEVAGRDEDEATLRGKADWYLARGVEVVWLVLPEQREVVVLVPGNDRRFRSGQKLRPHSALPGLEPGVDEFFVQISIR